MTYKDLVSDPEERNKFFVEELGIPEEKVPERVVVTPIQYSSTLPEDFIYGLREIGLQIEAYTPGDLILKSIAKNYVISNGNRSLALILLGRGLTEFTDRIYILSTSPRVKDILFLGTAASLQGDVAAGDINVPEIAIPFESVSVLHVDVTRATPRADPELRAEIEGYLKKLSEVKTHNRLHATVTLFYQETREFLEYLRDIGVATIDMEISAFYRIARFYGKRAAAVVRVGDLPLHGKHILTEDYKEYRKRQKEQAKGAILRTMLAFGLGEDVARKL